MKRDLDLVREILKDVAAAQGAVDASAWTCETRPLDLIGYHIEIMDEAGLIVGNVHHDAFGHTINASVERLTWGGNDFLASVTSDSVWRNVKKTIATKLGDASFETLKALAIKTASGILECN